MKIIHCLFPLYLIVLSCLPCADLEVSSLLPSSQEIASNNNKHSQDNQDVCSPFCVCSCCGSQVFVFNSDYDFSFFKTTICTKVPEYQSKIDCNYFGSIWQPPQINS